MVIFKKQISKNKIQISLKLKKKNSKPKTYSNEFEVRSKTNFSHDLFIY